MSGGSADSWLVGAPAVILALLSIRVLGRVPAFRLSFWGGLKFILYFGKQSILSGFDVAWRSVQPCCPLRPGFIHYPFRLSSDVSRLFLVNTISLLPGTLSVDLQRDGVLVHVLDENSPNVSNLRTLEDKVAAMFGEKPAVSAGSGPNGRPLP